MTLPEASHVSFMGLGDTSEHSHEGSMIIILL